MGLSTLFILATAAVVIATCFRKSDENDESYENAHSPSSQARTPHGNTTERSRTDHVRTQNTHATQVYAPTDHSKVQSTYVAPTQARPQPPTEYHGVQSSRTYTAPIPPRPQPPTNIWASRAQSTYTAPTYAPPEPPTTVRPDVHVVPLVPSSRVALERTRYDFSVYGEEDSQSYMPEPISPGADVSHRDFNATQRAPAKRAYDRMRDAQTMQKQAYKRRDRREAERLSIVIKQAKEEAELLNTTAAERIFKENNKNRRANDVDLHGLYVQEAIKFAEASITVSQSRGFQTLKLIVGKGLHTSDGVAKVKPAIEKMLKRRGLIVAEQRGNAGALIVQLGSGACVSDDSDDSDVYEM